MLNGEACLKKKKKSAKCEATPHLSLHIPFYLFTKIRCDWAFYRGSWKNVKHRAPFPNLSLPNSNLETASYLTTLKSYGAVMLVLNTAHFAFQVLLVLQFGAP